MSVKQLTGKFWPFEIGLKVSIKKKIEKVESEEKKVRVRKEKCVKKLRIHLIFMQNKVTLLMLIIPICL
jgi:hypothetical protein